jgi:hypothetical protein
VADVQIAIVLRREQDGRDGVRRDSCTLGQDIWDRPGGQADFTVFAQLRDAGVAGSEIDAEQTA